VTDDGFGFPGGPGYVWHCHIVDHEDNEMMRPLIITEPALATRAVRPAGVMALATAVELAASRPNPVTNTVTIGFALPAAMPVELGIFDIHGRGIATLASGTFAAGSHAVSWDGRDRAGNRVAPGMYLYRLRAGSVNQVRRLVLVR
jgi:hypothetical protein